MSCNSAYEPHETYLSGSTFLLHHENHKHFGHFLHGGETNFLVLAQANVVKRCNHLFRAIRAHVISPSFATLS